MTCNNIFVSLKKIIPPVDQSLCTCSQLINRILIYNFRHSHTKILKNFLIEILCIVLKHGNLLGMCIV